MILETILTVQLFGGVTFNDCPADRLRTFLESTCECTLDSDDFNSFLRAPTVRLRRELLRKMYLSGQWDWKYLDNFAKAAKANHFI